MTIWVNGYIKQKNLECLHALIKYWEDINSMKQRKDIRNFHIKHNQRKYIEKNKASKSLVIFKSH